MLQTLRNIISTAAIIIAVSVCCKAQTFTNVPNDSIVAAGSIDEAVVYDIAQIGNIPDTIILSWEKVSAVVPDSWEALICDNKVCYPDLHEGSTMLPVYNGQNGLMSLHVTPHQNEGMAIIRYAVWDNNNPTVIDTLTWIISVFQTGINAVQQNPFDIFISGNELVIQKNDPVLNKIRIIDVNGSILKENSDNAMKISIDVSDLRQGIYLVEAMSNNLRFTRRIFVP